MHTSARQLLSMGGILLAAAAIPAAAATAQGTLQPVRVTAEGVSRADRLRAEADALPARTDQFRKAARLYQRSAEARAPGDSATPTCLRTAAYLFYYSGDSNAGADLMEQAAQTSVEHGDVVRAANAYIDAAYIAAEIRQNDRAVELGRRAQLLATSPLLTDDQRAALRTRMVGWPDAVVAMKP